MKKKQKQTHRQGPRSPKNPSQAHQEATFLHIRRCHVCGFLNESCNSDVDRCRGCDKALAPFLFCESTYDSEAIELSRKVFTTHKNESKVIYPPLVGIALYW